MNKKLILFIGIFLKVSVLNCMQLPSEQEVMATRNPLTIVLYALHQRYLHNPVIPTDVTFESRLENHILLKEKWLKPNGFFEILQKAHQTGSSVDELKIAIEKNESYIKFAQWNMHVTQRLLMANILQAYKDCSFQKP